MTAAVMTNLGYLALRLGDWDRAAAESQRALERSRVVGDRAAVVVALVNLRFASIHRERPEEAASGVRRSARVPSRPRRP